MSNFASEAMDNLDACLFSGDPANVDMEELKMMLERWGRWYEENKDFALEMEDESKAS